MFEKYDVEEDNKECIREIEDQISYNSSIKEVLGKMSTKFENWYKITTPAERIPKSTTFSNVTTSLPLALQCSVFDGTAERDIFPFFIYKFENCISCKLI